MSEQEQHQTDTVAPNHRPGSRMDRSSGAAPALGVGGGDAFVIVVVYCVHAWMQSHVFTLLAMLIMLGSLAKFYFPTHYKMDDRTVTVKTTTQTLVKEWKLYRSCYPDKKGILLSPFATPTRLENFRGLYVMFERNNEVVTAFVQGTNRPRAAERRDRRPRGRRRDELLPAASHPSTIPRSSRFPKKRWRCWIKRPSGS